MSNVERICRLCLKNEKVKSFTDISAKRNSGTGLQIFLLAGIKVEPFLNIPALICDECRKFLCKVDKFRLRCLEADKYFQEILEKDEVVEVYLEEELQGEGLKIIKIEPDNDSIEPSRDEGKDLSSPTIELQTSAAKPEAIRIRKKPIKAVKSLTKKKTEAKKERNKSRYRPMCPVCGKEQESEYRLIQHERIAHTQLNQMSADDVVVCDLCARIFKTKQSLRNHFIRAHTPATEKFPCSVCGKVLSHMKALYAHERVHIKSEVTCQYCAKTFDRKVLLSSHIAIVHLKKRLSQCQYCPHQAITGGALKKHIRCKHLNLREHHCEWPDCGKSFHENQHLVRHFRSHTQERPFECRIEGCGKAFSDHAKRSRHEKQNCPKRNV